MQRIILGTAAAAALMMATASAETQSYDMPGFTGIDVSSGIQLIFEAGETQSITAEAIRGDIDKLVIEMDGDTLVVRRERGWNWGGRSPKYRVTVTGPAISSLEASSGSSATANGFVGDYITLDASSGASLRASSVSGGEISIDTSSGASLSAAGNCSRVSIDTSSGSSVSAGTLECTEVVADASSGSSINAYATQRVVGDASSGASVSVQGGATDVRIDRSSGGSVSVT
ncbi:MAG: DUF2807 domain-containing protein [Pseudomonadota bacterium]